MGQDIFFPPPRGGRYLNPRSAVEIPGATRGINWLHVPQEQARCEPNYPDESCASQGPEAWSGWLL